MRPPAGAGTTSIVMLHFGVAGGNADQREERASTRLQRPRRVRILDGEMAPRTRLELVLPT